jgi:Holliday junction resolvase YEN1
LIRTHYEKGKSEGPKSKTHVRVFRAQDILQKPGLERMDKHGMVLFAMLNGGDYDTDGLHGCGDKTALRAVRRGFGQTLAALDPKSSGLQAWRDSLQQELRLSVPSSFPKPKAWNYYRNPTVTQDMSVFQTVWAPRPIEEMVLRDLSWNRST